MKRTTVLLPDDLAVRLELRRGHMRVSTSELLRRALEAYLAPPPGIGREISFAGIGRSGTRQTARQAEEILEREWGSDGAARGR